MKCKKRGCPASTEAKNGICCNCWAVQKRLKSFLQTEDGMDFLRALLKNAFGLEIVPEPEGSHR